MAAEPHPDQADYEAGDPSMEDGGMEADSCPYGTAEDGTCRAPTEEDMHAQAEMEAHGDGLPEGHPPEEGDDSQRLPEEMPEDQGPDGEDKELEAQREHEMMMAEQEQRRLEEAAKEEAMAMEKEEAAAMEAQTANTLTDAPTDAPLEEPKASEMPYREPETEMPHQEVPKDVEMPHREPELENPHSEAQSMPPPNELHPPKMPPKIVPQNAKVPPPPKNPFAKSHPGEAKAKGKMGKAKEKDKTEAAYNQLLMEKMKLEKELKEAKNSLAQAAASGANRDDEQLESLSQELEEVRTAFREEQAKHDNEMSEMRSSKDALTGRYESLQETMQDQLTKHRQEMADVQSSQATLSQEYEKLKLSIKEAELHRKPLAPGELAQVEWKSTVAALFNLGSVMNFWFSSTAVQAANMLAQFLHVEPPLNIVACLFFCFTLFMAFLRMLPIGGSTPMPSNGATPRSVPTPPVAAASLGAAGPEVKELALTVQRLQQHVEALSQAQAQAVAEVRRVGMESCQSSAKLQVELHAFHRERSSIDEEMLLSTKEILEWLGNGVGPHGSPSSAAPIVTIAAPLQDAGITPLNGTITKELSPTPAPSLPVEEATPNFGAPSQPPVITNPLLHRPAVEEATPNFGQTAAAPPVAPVQAEIPAAAAPVVAAAPSMPSAAPSEAPVPAPAPPAETPPAAVPPVSASPPAAAWETPLEAQSTQPPTIGMQQPAPQPTAVPPQPTPSQAQVPAPALPAEAPPAAMPPVSASPPAAALETPLEAQPTAQPTAPPPTQTQFQAEPPAPQPTLSQPMAPPSQPPAEEAQGAPPAGPPAPLAAASPPAEVPGAPPAPGPMAAGPPTAGVSGRPQPKPYASAGNPFGAAARPKPQAYQAAANPFGAARPQPKEYGAAKSPFG